MTTSYFCVHYKNRRKHNLHFKLLFFQVYLHFGTSNEISAYSKTCLLHINSIHLVLSSLDLQRRVIKIKYTTSFFTLWKETTPKPSKVATAKDFSHSVHVIVTICFEKYFLFLVITGFIKVY